MPQGKWFRIGYGIIVALLIAYLASKVDFVFNPIKKVLAALFVPLLISGIFYYLFRPFVRLFSTKLPKTLAILLVYVGAIGVCYLFFWMIWPPIRDQSINLVDNFPQIVDSVRTWIESLQQHEWLKEIGQKDALSSENITNKLTGSLDGLLNSVIGSVRGIFNLIMRFFFLLGLVPFMIYYLLSEGDKLPDRILRLLPDRYHRVVGGALKEIDTSIGSFILSKVLTSLLIGMLTFIGYMFIHVPYPLLLGMVAAITNFIPYIGPLIAFVPTAIVALTVSPMTVLLVGIVLIVSNQIEANVIGPRIIGKQMNVHPFTVMLLVIGASAIIGPFGMIIVVPVYAIIKIVANRTYDFYKHNHIPPIDPLAEMNKRHD
ncbi:AI-2E family transporter [Paenibacillus sacheonensis]|uniref:AI-2E family transporter n=1 Tax=Paenibacillus sacheonensis TaxID=742054 RepID=A0A7X4YW75_9BACL|nr:AI-2E family transporter [Paenibacillus sacheonensis]MBM7569479.1 putative PurR-regulated permease PerM [Paenibacillus sacheonensis]NBC73588.1 AI-2E family transporter [Paenibacillus sacheonensis]